MAAVELMPYNIMTREASHGYRAAESKLSRPSPTSKTKTPAK